MVALAVVAVAAAAVGVNEMVVAAVVCGDCGDGGSCHDCDGDGGVEANMTILIKVWKKKQKEMRR